MGDSGADGNDQRGAFARDRDRILYCSAFRRLAGVTQVVNVAEGQMFHNRLTHTMKVAQIARRLAELLRTKDHTQADKLCIHPEVVEGAALAHDLGHPPFGHLGEVTLNECVRKHGTTDGYEGNAQSFRILTRLATRREDKAGLDLTRATLNAVLKYPWLYRQGNDKNQKFGAYVSEENEFDFARTGFEGDEEQCAAAFLMDWADDIAYSVHDIEDFYRAGLVPLDRLAVDPAEQERVAQFVAQRDANMTADAALTALGHVLSSMSEPLRSRYEATLEQRGALRFFTSTLVGRYVRSVEFDGSGEHPGLKVASAFTTEVRTLKRLMEYYVFSHPALAAQQYGQRRTVMELFEIFFDLINDDRAQMRIPSAQNVLPRSIRDHVRKYSRSDAPRLVADAISGMTEEQALALHSRLTGVQPGSIWNAIVP